MSKKTTGMTKTVYMCDTDFRNELEYCEVSVYPTKEKALKEVKCLCGIAKVKIEYIEQVKESREKFATSEDK